MQHAGDASAAAVTRPTGSTHHKASVTALNRITATSKRANGTGSRPGFSRTSQLRVKLGIMRPPMTAISSTVAAMPTRLPYSALPRTMRLQMKGDVAGEQQRHHGDHS